MIFAARVTKPFTITQFYMTFKEKRHPCKYVKQNKTKQTHETKQNKKDNIVHIVSVN